MGNDIINELSKLPDSFLNKLFDLLEDTKNFVRLKGHLSHNSINIVDREYDCQISINSIEELENVKKQVEIIMEEMLDE